MHPPDGVFQEVFNMPAAVLHPHRGLTALAMALALALVLLAGCGGGSSDSPTPAPRWTPALTDTWQWQLKGSINTAYDAQVYDIDLFDAPRATIDELKSQGRRVVCYFSAGSAEDWRADFARFQPADLGQALIGWPGERWLDTRSDNVRQIMKDRLKQAADRGCDGVEPDNVDAHTQPTGLALTALTQLDYNRFLAREAHALGLAIGLKNNVGQLAELVADFDFAVNEQCHQYGECAGYAVFTSVGKPVFNAEYQSSWQTDATARASLCASARAANLRTLVLARELDDSLRWSCD
jgi:hypothetical protein